MMDTFATAPKYDSYKNTGIEWLSEIPTEWNVEKAKWLFYKAGRPVNKDDEIVTCFRDGQVTLRSKRRTEGFTNALKEHGYQGIRKGDLVIHAMDAFAGAIGISDSDGKSTPVYAACVPRIPNIVNPSFFAYYMRDLALSGFIVSLAKGIRERSTDFRFNDFAQLQLPLPNLSVQDKIVSFLDIKTTQIDEAIAIKEKQIALLKERKQIIIQKAVTQGLNTDIQMKDSGVDWIGQIPEHWKVKKLKFFCKFNGGGTPSKDNMKFWENGNIPWVSPKDMKSDRIDKTQDYITQLAIKNSATNYVSPNSLLIVVRSGILQRKIPVAINDVTVTLNQDMKALSLHKNVMSSEYLKYFIEGNNDSLLVEWTKEGATVESIEHEFIANGQIPIPPLEEQEKIVEYLNKLDESMLYTIENQIVQIGRLKEYKATLINSAVTGKIKVA
jgi:type I restriction enzyme S subunit